MSCGISAMHGIYPRWRWARWNGRSTRSLILGILPARIEEAKERLQEIRADSFVVDHTNTIQTLGGLFSQLEMDRLWDSIAIVRSYHLFKSQVLGDC